MRSRTRAGRWALTPGVAIVLPGALLCVGACTESSTSGAGDGGAGRVGAPDAIVVNGAAFSASIPEAEWVVPAAGRGAEIGLALEISNRGPEPLVFDLHDTVWVEMSLDGVEWRRMVGGRNGSRAAPTLSRPIAPGETLRVERPARLEARADGVRLIGDDPFGGVWHVDAVPIGAVWFRFWYKAAPDGDRGARVWAGDARTRPVRVRVREQEGDEP